MLIELTVDPDTNEVNVAFDEDALTPPVAELLANLIFAGMQDGGSVTEIPAHVAEGLVEVLRKISAGHHDEDDVNAAFRCLQLEAELEGLRLGSAECCKRFAEFYAALVEDRAGARRGPTKRGRPTGQGGSGYQQSGVRSGLAAALRRKTAAGA
jgi:hypothetical protein